MPQQKTKKEICSVLGNGCEKRTTRTLWLGAPSPGPNPPDLLLSELSLRVPWRCSTSCTAPATDILLDCWDPGFLSMCFCCFCFFLIQILTSFFVAAWRNGSSDQPSGGPFFAWPFLSRSPDRQRFLPSTAAPVSPLITCFELI